MCVFKKNFKILVTKLTIKLFFSFMHCTIVLVKVTFPWNLFVPKLQSNSNFPSWISLICVLKLPLVEKFLSQNLYLNASFPSCIKEMCAVEKVFFQNFLSQNLHLNAIFLLWIALLCTFKLSFSWEILVTKFTFKRLI